MSFAVRRPFLLALMAPLIWSASACDHRREGAIEVTVIGDEQPELVEPSEGELDPPQAVLLTNAAQGLVRFDARGQIEPGLAERWNVSDDGLSYIFRLAPGEWSNGDEITAHQVARILRRQTASRGTNRLRDALGAVEEIVAMTDRVLEIRLRSPRPNLLQLLAQPEFSLVRNGAGTGPFRIVEGAAGESRIRLERDVTGTEGELERREEVLLDSSLAPAAVRRFAQGNVDLVLGGRFSDLPYARTNGVPAAALRFDPAAGLFGLAPARTSGPIADPELRRILAQAIDRQALVDAFAVPGLLPRATLLEPGLEPMPDPVPPEWFATALADRQQELATAAAEMFEEAEARPLLRISLPNGPGSELLLNRLAQDWAPLGISVERAAPGAPADLRLIDEVAPSSGAPWFLRRFRCGEAAVCNEQADELLAAARAAPVTAQRSALLLEAARLMEEAQLFIPIAAPIRWSLVSDQLQGFAPNRFARHPLTALDERLNRERAE